ncbi:3'(2'),5'-bisphosphate nucleotidase CysQ family protein [Campylobacter pinnipediorum]|uniref:3'(2'),5'-bisphosphate nucleotidase CysQ family protein n=1 Tax=Campylobacter pinnipediorum TaxID=1965231 RepID=UPI000ACA3762|nr:inositol monophosphatase family protein [Campylobacter pinnipediorum]
MLCLAKQAAINAGFEILRHYNDFEVSLKKDKSPVTTADIASNNIIFKTLEQTKIPICSEEEILTNNSDMFWLIDPLDGTSGFIEKSSEFCICISLVKNFTPILGVIFIPMTNELFYGSENGAFKEKLDNNYKVNSLINLNEIVRDKGIVYASHQSDNIKHNSLANKLGFRPQKLGSAIKFCRLAETSGIYLRMGPSSIWDNCAGDALIRSCGGITIDVYTKEPMAYSVTKLKSPFFICISKEFIDKKDEIVRHVFEV